MVGKKMRAYREFRGYSQIQLAELSGINVGTIRKYELGIRNPKPDQLEKIATALRLNVSVFLDFNIETFQFTIIQNNREPFDFNSMSMGYATVFDIIGDLIMRMEAHRRYDYRRLGAD